MYNPYQNCVTINLPTYSGHETQPNVMVTEQRDTEVSDVYEKPLGSSPSIDYLHAELTKNAKNRQSTQIGTSANTADQSMS